jgi:DinB superfamily
MDYTQLFTKLLQSGTDALLWAIQQVPESRLYIVSAKRPESWSVARIVLHIHSQEEQVVLPCMRLWLSEEDAAPYRAEDDKRIERYKDYQMLVHDEEIAWQQAPDMQILQKKFREGRKEQIALLAQVAPEVWEETRETVWGQVTLRWAIIKTYQHTLEHSNDILKHALYGGELRAFEEG